MLFNIWKTSVFLFGLVFIVVVPPFHSPDEFNHFYKAYDISEGHLTPTVDYAKMELGGYVPKSLLEVSAPFEKGKFKEDYKFSVDTILHYLKLPLNRQEMVFTDFPNTARYAPTAYTPQVFAILVCKFFDLPPLSILYISRLLAFLLWFTILCFSIHRTPIFKGGLMILSALPASLAVNSTMSADVFSNALCFFALSCFLKMRVSETVSKRDLYLFSAALFVVTLNKICYFPLVFLLFFVDTQCFEPQFPKWRFITANLIINLVIILVWTHFVNTWIYPTNDVNVTTYRTMRLDETINPTLQLRYVFDHFVPYTLELLGKSFAAFEVTWKLYLTSAGWEFVHIRLNLANILLFTLLFYFLFQKNLFSWKERLLLFGIAHSMTLLFLFSMHLHWDGVGKEMIYAYGGKYYVPIYPIILLSISGILSRLGEVVFLKKYGFIVVIGVFVVVYGSFFQLLLERYYGW
jgi:uncharacterized membrane protein